MELYDILFFDWFLLCHSNFFPHFYPELKGIVGPHMFGYNKRTHILHFLLYIPLCAVIAGICMIFLNAPAPPGDSPVCFSQLFCTFRLTSRNICGNISEQLKDCKRASGGIGRLARFRF